MEVIGLIGLAGAGKSTVAMRLIAEHGFARAKFAGSLKAMLRAFLAYRGASPSTIERMIEGDLKEVPSPMLNGRTPRHAMVTLGTEWGRDLIDVDLWVDTEVEHLQVAALDRAEPRFVFDDVRFPNEVAAIRRLGGQVWRVEREGLFRADGAHDSERLDVEPDRVITNRVGLFADLWRQVDDLAPARDERLHPCLCAEAMGNPDCVCDSTHPTCVPTRVDAVPLCRDAVLTARVDVKAARLVVAISSTPIDVSAVRTVIADEVNTFPASTDGDPLDLVPARRQAAPDCGCAPGVRCHETYKPDCPRIAPAPADCRCLPGKRCKPGLPCPRAAR